MSHYTLAHSTYNASTKFESELHKLIESVEFDNDLGAKGIEKPHEAMSSIIGINLGMIMIRSFYKIDNGYRIFFS